MPKDTVTEALSKLVREGERVCNCGRAFETWHHQSESLSWDANGTPIGRYLCMYGCSAAQIAATDRLAQAFLDGKRPG